MSFASRLDHIVHLERLDDTGQDDDDGQPVTTHEVGADFAAAIQPKSMREMALLSQAGAEVGDYTIFCEPRVLTTGNAVIHDTMTCPKANPVDFPTLRFEIRGVRNAAGRGHHLEVDAHRVGTPGSGVEGS